MDVQSDIQIVVVSRQPETDAVLRNIRKWCFTAERQFTQAPHISVAKRTDLSQALDYLRHLHGKIILMPIGFDVDEVLPCLTQEECHQLEVIIRPRRPDYYGRGDDAPSSSLLSDTHTVRVHNTIPALQKSITRLRLQDAVHILPLTERWQVADYFALRYRVWKQLNYLAPERDCSQSGWELDYTDRTAFPIGAFDADNRLLGCARLVFPPHVAAGSAPLLIEQMLAERNDAELKRGYEYPPGLNHPFDLLDSFPNFSKYYARVVRTRLSKAEVSRVIVEPESRHQGVGEVLVDSLISIARRQRLDVLFLACLEKHHGFYERSGFRRLANMKCEHFSVVNVPAIAMTCNLRKHGRPVMH